MNEKNAIYGIYESPETPNEGANNL